MQLRSLLSCGLGLLFCTLLTTSYAATSALTATTFSDANKNILLAKNNPEFTITLAANPTTGYSWHLVNYDQLLISLVNHVYQAPENTMPGAGGKEIWTFAANKTAFIAPQVSKITLLYARPWNLKDNSKQVEFTVVTR